MHLTSPRANQRSHDIAFLHTGAQHVETFSNLVCAVAPELKVLHIVREDLLIDALQPCIGIGNAGLLMRIKRATRHAGDSGARVVVCTWSPLGGVVEALNVKAKKQALITTRIDRAMADVAATRGAPIILVATLESTIAPSTALLQSSATAVNTYTPMTPVLVGKAWAHFLAGDQAAYISEIVEAVTKVYTAHNPANTEAARPTVVLAQASMHDAVALLAARGIPALSSPKLGVQHAVALVAQQQSVSSNARKQAADQG